MAINTKEQHFQLTKDKVLIISTRKSGNRLKSYASVKRVEGKFLVHTMFKDFNKCIIVSNPTIITQKKADLQAANIDIEAVKKQALAFYTNKAGE